MISRAWAFDHFDEFLARLLASRSMRQVAHRAGIHYSTLSRIANGKHEPLYSTVKRIVDAYTR